MLKIRKMKIFIFLFFSIISICTNAQDVAILKYNGGGDWYSNPTAIPNLVQFANTNIKTSISKNPQTVAVGSEDVFNFPMLFMTGHGNVSFSDSGSANLKKYLLSGGFLHADDNYGMKPYFIKAMKKVFPNKQWKELPLDHDIFTDTYSFANGLPKIHRHDGKRPQALALVHKGRLIVLFTTESDISDGWEDPSVHNDPQTVRSKALKMGANIIHYAFTH